jgi:glycosyltransferase involved in cell wall biosynthesis
MTPAVDIVIPTRNRWELTLEAVESVKRQTFRDWHLVVVDDASDDDRGYPAFAECVSRDARIRLIRRAERGGSNRARQTGADASSAPLVAILDSDDLWLPGKLQRQVEIMRSMPCDGAVGIALCWHDYEDVTATRRGRVHRPKLDGHSSPLASFNTSTPLVRRAVLEAAGGFAPDGARWFRTADHVDLFVRLLFHSNVVVAPHLLVICRHHAGERNSDAQGTLRAADEAAAVLAQFDGDLAADPRQRAWLLAWVAARYLLVGNRRAGLRFLRSACLAGDQVTATRILQHYGAYTVKRLALSSRR